MKQGVFILWGVLITVLLIIVIVKLDRLCGSVSGYKKLSNPGCSTSEQMECSSQGLGCDPSNPGPCSSCVDQDGNAADPEGEGCVPTNCLAGLQGQGYCTGGPAPDPHL